jgi:hypothetical protein
MLKNEIRAEMDVVKIGIQSLIAFLFALLLLAVQGYVKPLELYASITVLALITLFFLIRKYKYLGKRLDNLEVSNNG